MPSKILELRRKVSGSFNNGDSLSYVKTNWSGIDGKPSVYPPAGHTHPWAQVTGKPSIMTVQEGTDGEDTAAKILNAYNLKGIIQGLMPLIPEVMSVQEGIDGYYTDARTINATNLRGIIEDYVDTYKDYVDQVRMLSSPNKTLVLTDAGKMLYASANYTREFIIPPAATTDFPIGTRIQFYRRYSQTMTISCSSPVTLNGGTSVSISNQYKMIEIFKIGTNEWVAIGAIT